MPINEYIKNNYERLEKITFRTLSNISYLISAGAGLDALRNLHNGVTTGDTTYYLTAATELLASGLFGAAGYAMRKQLREKIETTKLLQEFGESYEKLVDGLERVVGTLEEKSNVFHPISANEQTEFDYTGLGRLKLENLPQHFREAKEYYENVLRKDENWMKKNLGRHVAIIGKQVVDVDENFGRLAERVRKKHGYGPLFMPEVTSYYPPTDTLYAIDTNNLVNAFLSWKCRT